MGMKPVPQLDFSLLLRIRRNDSVSVPGLTQKLWLLIGQDLVEDVVVSLGFELENYTGFLQEI